MYRKKLEDIIWSNTDGKIYRSKDGYYKNGDYHFNDYKSALEAMRKKYEEPPEPTTKEKAQEILDKLNKDKNVRAEFDKLVRQEKLRKINKES